MADLMPLARKRFGQFSCALAGPAQWRHGIATCRRFYQRFQRGDQGRIMALERFAPAARPPNPPAGRTRQRRMVQHFLTPATNRPLPEARGLGHGLDPTVPQLESFAGGPAATPALIQLRRKAGELSSQHFYNVVIYHVIKVVQAHKIGQLFIYDDLGCIVFFRMCIKVRGRVGTNEPKDRRKNDGEKGEGVGKILTAPQSLKPLAEFYSKDIDFPSIEF